MRAHATAQQVQDVWRQQHMRAQASMQHMRESTIISTACVRSVEAAAYASTHDAYGAASASQCKECPWYVLGTHDGDVQRPCHCFVQCHVCCPGVLPTFTQFIGLPHVRICTDVKMVHPACCPGMLCPQSGVYPESFRTHQISQYQTINVKSECSLNAEFVRA